MFQTLISLIFHTFLDAVFPQTDIEKKYEAIHIEYFAKKAVRAKNEPASNSSLLEIESLLSYKDPLVHEALWELKYRGNRKIAKLFAALLYDHMIEILAEDALFLNFSAPLLIPIPLSKERMKERGWNQSEMIARELKKFDKNNFFTLETKLLKKVRYTKPQTTLKKRERLENLKNCFALGKNQKEILKNAEKICNRNIILLDDVTTTGATIAEATRALKIAGARCIRAFTIAH